MNQYSHNKDWAQLIAYLVCLVQDLWGNDHGSVCCPDDVTSRLQTAVQKFCFRCIYADECPCVPLQDDSQTSASINDWFRCIAEVDIKIQISHTSSSWMSVVRVYNSVLQAFSVQTFTRKCIAAQETIVILLWFVIRSVSDLFGVSI